VAKCEIEKFGFTLISQVVKQLVEKSAC